MACRRCSDCEGEEHHWIENVRDSGPSFVCKHCPALGEFYSVVEGLDEIDDEDEKIVEVAR